MCKLISKSASYQSKQTPLQMTHLSWSLKLLHMFSIEKTQAEKSLVLHARIACLCYQRNDPRKYWVEDKRLVSFLQLECCAVLLTSAPSFQDENSHSSHYWRSWWLTALRRYSQRTVLCQGEHLICADPFSEASLHPGTDSSSRSKGSDSFLQSDATLKGHQINVLNCAPLQSMCGTLNPQDLSI